MLELKDIEVSFRKVKALKGFSIKAERGSIFGLVGANGAGKTTALRVAAGLQEPEKGEVLWDGLDLLAHSSERKALVGYMPDTFGVYGNLQVWEYMEFFANASGLEGLKARKTGLEFLERVGLSGMQDEYVNHLSRGMKQRLSLARAVLHDPKILLLDEPAAGFDPGSRKYLWEILRALSEGGTTILVSSHILSELTDVCTEIGVIREGKTVLQGTMEDIRRKMRLNNPLKISVREKGEVAAGILGKLSCVKTVAREENELLLTVDGGEEEEAELLAVLVREGIPVYSFVRRPGDLDSLFFAMMEGKDKVISSNETEPGIA